MQLITIREKINSKMFLIIFMALVVINKLKVSNYFYLLVWAGTG
jgi:hypothetical protein